MAIISAARRDMIGATLYIACIDPETDELVPGTNSCAMCKRLIINAGIAKVVVRDTQDSYRAILVEDWGRKRRVAGGRKRVLIFHGSSIA